MNKIKLDPTDTIGQFWPEFRQWSTDYHTQGARWGKFYY